MSFMANVAASWSNEGIPNRGYGQALGTPRVRKAVSQDVVFPIVAPFADQKLSSQDATFQIPRPRKTTYRVGAALPSESSLLGFVLIGVAVGLLAFLIMTLAQPAQHRVSLPAAAHVVESPQLAPIAVAPPAAEVVAAEVVAAVTPQVAPKAAPAKRRTAKSKKAAVPANPYGS